MTDDVTDDATGGGGTPQEPESFEPQEQSWGTFPTDR
jgi:hypothetical protein